MKITMTRSYVPICVFSPFICLFLNYLNIIRFIDMNTLGKIANASPDVLEVRSAIDRFK